MNATTLILVALVAWWLLLREDPTPTSTRAPTPAPAPDPAAPGFVAGGSCGGRGWPGCESEYRIQAWTGPLGVSPNY
jgi:hypothetical protein